MKNQPGEKNTPGLFYPVKIYPENMHDFYKIFNFAARSFWKESLVL